MGKINIVLDIQDKINAVHERQNFKRDVIERKYKESKEKLEKENKTISEFLEREMALIEEYSRFRNVYNIMTVLADITSLYMGEEYLYKTNDEYPMLIPKELDNNEQIIFFDDEYNPSDDSLQFYKYDDVEVTDLFQFTLYESDNLEKYDFLKRFIDYVISYKREISRCSLSCDVLDKLERDFILENIDEIKKINEDVSRLCIKEQKDITREREKRLNKILEKYTKVDNY